MVDTKREDKADTTFILKYVKTEISVSAVKADVCAKTDSPPKPSEKAVRIKARRGNSMYTVVI